MSSRAEKRREKTRTPKAPAKPWKAIEITETALRVLVLLLIAALPWYYGSVKWQTQYILAWVGLCFCVCIAIHAVVSVVTKSGDLSVPWLTWIFFGVAAFAFVQSIPAFSWQPNSFSPSSVSMQRWALGLTNAPTAIQDKILPNPKEPVLAESPTTASSIPCDLKGVPESEQTLAWSIEPLHTRGGVAGLLLCGLFVWLGRMVFSGSRKQLWLFGALTAIGILIACVGIQGAVSHQSVNFLGLKSGSSFATFVSKNSAGGFYNICIAGCLGLLGWTLLNTQRTSKDTRYRFPDTNILSKIRGFAEDSLADLNTAQIAVALCLIFVVSALLISLCRGAAISALGAIIVASMVANAKSRSRGTWAIFFAIATAFIACMVGFQIDEKAYARLESLSEIVIEDEFREGRAYIWSIAWKAMMFYSWLGSGLGTFHFAYLPFQEPSSTGWYYHAESLYAQCGVELGYIGLSVLILSTIKLLSEVQRPAAQENWAIAFPSKLAGTYLLVSQALHSFVDFAIIIPSLFIPACVLIGSVQGTLRKSEIAPVRKRSRSSSATPATPTPTKNQTWMANGMLALSTVVVSALSIFYVTTSLKSLAASEAMADWTKVEEAKRLEEQSIDRVREMASLWTLDNSSLRRDPSAMRSFADAILFNYRMNQLTSAPIASTRAEAWTGTSPVFLRLALEQVQDKIKRNQIIDVVGGKPAMELLDKSANWYALGQTKSPLDWRLIWGRCFANLVCEPDEVAKLLPASLTLAKHNAQQLLAASVLHRKHFDQKQYNQILGQAMKSSILTAANSAKLLALDRTDDEIPIAIFPQRYDVLRSIATDAFPKAKFPKTNRRLWEKAKELVATAPLTKSNREQWLADAAFALDDAVGEINHLSVASQNDPGNARLLSRFANRLLDLADANTEEDAMKRVREAIILIRKLDRGGADAENLEKRLKNR